MKSWVFPQVYHNSKTLYIRGKNPDGINLYINYTEYLSHFVFGIPTSPVDVSGNIMALIDYENENLVTLSNYYIAFKSLFENQNALTNANKLKLPATILSEYCYSRMFSGCTNLTTGPELPAKTLVGSCYSQMFAGCTSLTIAPELPATAATGTFSYGWMFSGCTSLTESPILPIRIIPGYGYYGMFSDCINLRKVTLLAISYNSSDSLGSWLNNVSSTGTLLKLSSATWKAGYNGIPSGWTVINYDT